MGMRLTSVQLARLAQVLEELEKVEVDVKTFEFEGHGIVIERVQYDQRDPQHGTRRLCVRGITDRPSGLPGGAVMRDARDS